MQAAQPEDDGFVPLEGAAAEDTVMKEEEQPAKAAEDAALPLKVELDVPNGSHTKQASGA